MKVTDHSANHCPVEVTLSVIGGKWKPLILWRLSEDGVHRFLELQRTIPGLTRKMLTQHLRELERDGIVARKISLRRQFALNTRSRNTVRHCDR
jgi:DNA-binding HxlR family transcriptional regulator